MSSYSEGYDQGKSDAASGSDDTYNFITGMGDYLMDLVFPFMELDEDWKKGYQDGYEG